MKIQKIKYLLALFGLSLLALTFSAQAAWCLKLESSLISRVSELSGGTLNNLSLSVAGLSLGPKITKISDSLPGDAMAFLMKGSSFYVATSNPAKVYEIRAGHKPKVIFEATMPFITSLVSVLRDEIAIVTAPNGGVYFLKTDRVKGKPVFVNVPQVKTLLQAAVYRDKLFLVGGGVSGKLLSIDTKTKKVRSLLKVQESYLRSLFIDHKSAAKKIYLGSAGEGIIYEWKKNELKSVFQASSSEVIRIDPSGIVEVLWQSTKHNAKTLLLNQAGSKLLLGTGQKGRIYSLSPNGKEPAEVLANFKEQKEVVALSENNGIIFGCSSFKSQVFSLNSRVRANSGQYLSDIIDAGGMAHFGTVLLNAKDKWHQNLRVAIRVGNEKNPKASWSKFIDLPKQKRKLANMPARYAQVKLSFADKVSKNSQAVVSEIKLWHELVNRAPRIGQVELLDFGMKLEAKETAIKTKHILGLGKDVFKGFKVSPDKFAFPAEITKAVLSYEPGYVSVYSWAVDPDGDDLSYKFSIATLGEKKIGHDLKWRILQDWSNVPFVSFDGTKLADSNYRILVEVNDKNSNSPKTSLADRAMTPIFSLTNALPKFYKTAAKRTKRGVRVSFNVKAAMPIVDVRCTMSSKNWQIIEPINGLLGSLQDRFQTTLQGKPWFKHVSCLAVDESGKIGRAKIAVK